MISALQKELDHARHLNESYRGNIIKQKAFLGGLDNTVEERHRAIKQLELEMDAMKVKARNEMEAEREEILKASRVLQQENYALFNEVHVRTVLLEDQLARARTMFTTIDGTISSSATLFEGLPAGRMQLFNEELEAIEKSVNNMKAYLKLRRPQEFAAEPLSTLSDATDLDAARKTITSANVDEQLQDLLIRLEKGIEFVKKRRGLGCERNDFAVCVVMTIPSASSGIVIKAEVDAQTRNHDKTVLIHRYHYEQFLHYLQYLRDLVRLSRQGNSSTSSGDGKHPTPAHRISSEAVRFQRHYAPHLYRLYAVQATIALKTVESVYEIDTILSHVHAASEGTRVNVNGMLVQVHGLQEEISKLRKASTETIQLVTNKYRQAKKSARELQKTVEQLQQEKLIADAAKLFPDKEE